MKTLKEMFLEEGKTFDKYRSTNQMPISPDPYYSDRGWFAFVRKYDMGILDIDKFAGMLGFRDFEELEISYSSPIDLFNDKKVKFHNALKKSSLSASSITKVQLIRDLKEM